jgi:hypothetical protein
LQLKKILPFSFEKKIIHWQKNYPKRKIKRKRKHWIGARVCVCVCVVFFFPPIFLYIILENLFLHFSKSIQNLE